MGLGPSSEKDNSKSAQHIREQSSSTEFEKDDFEETNRKGVPISNKRSKMKDSPDSSPIMIMSPKSPIISPITSRRGSTQQSIQDSQPTVFRWNHGGKNVYLAGNFNQWQEKIPMNMSHNEFSCIQNLPAGTYYYRYIVDGKWQTDPSLPMATDSNGEVNNIIEIKETKKEDLLTWNKLAASSPPGSYGQNIPNMDNAQSSSLSQSLFADSSPYSLKSGSSPPSLPPHLLRALLNTAPIHSDPSMLPLPHHVMLNHLYSLPRKDTDALIVGITNRYKSKFVTTVYYKPMDNMSNNGSSSPNPFLSTISPPLSPLFAPLSPPTSPPPIIHSISMSSNNNNDDDDDDYDSNSLFPSFSSALSNSLTNNNNQKSNQNQDSDSMFA